MRKTEEKNKFIRPLAATTISLPPFCQLFKWLDLWTMKRIQMFFDFFFSTFF